MTQRARPAASARKRSTKELFPMPELPCTKTREGILASVAAKASRSSARCVSRPTKMRSAGFAWLAARARPEPPEAGLPFQNGQQIRALLATCRIPLQ